MKSFQLTDEQHHVLIQAHRLEQNKRFADRLKAIVLLDKGWTYAQISEALLIDESSIRRYQKVFEDGGVSAILQDHYQGGLSKLSLKQEAWLCEYLTEHVHSSTLEVIQLVKSHFQIVFTQSGMRDLLHRLGFHYKKMKGVPGKAEGIEQIEFVEKYEELKENLGKKDKIYFMDSSHPQHNSVSTYAWIPCGQEAKLKTNSSRTRLNIQGAINIQGPDVVVDAFKSVNADSTIQFLRKLESLNKEADQIYVILDNAGYHRAQSVKEYLLNSKIKLIFLPTYSPNLNLMERVWKFFHKHVLNNKYYPKYIEFKEASLEFFRKIKNFKPELKKLLNEKFEILGAF